MRIGVLGTGRMGRILAERFAVGHEVVLYDVNPDSAKPVAESLGLKSAASLAELEVDAAVLAVPDNAIKACVENMKETARQWKVFSIATNISREMLATFADSRVSILNVKIIGHAGEMSSGARPVIVVDQGEDAPVQTAREIFSLAGNVVVGEADQVKQINSIATEEALKAAVAVEEALRRAGVEDPDMVKSALTQVLTGVVKAYAVDDLGPFARGIVRALRDKSDGNMV